jgi:hypothetical protein
MKAREFAHAIVVALLLAGCTSTKPEITSEGTRDFNLRATALTQQNPDREGPPGYRTSYVRQLDDPNHVQLARPGMGMEDDPFRQYPKPEEWRSIDTSLRKLYVAQAQHPLIAVSEQILSAKFLDKRVLKQPATQETVTVAMFYTQLLLKHQTPEWNILLDVAEYVRPWVPQAKVNEIMEAVKVGAEADIATWQAKKQKYASETNQDPSATKDYLVAVSDAIIRAGGHALKRVEIPK